ncbi:hypothetical protein GYMLUDRAFT_43896 [Collybiopsis luxurians FD-317 M1]|uniref:F-box domain-containing protein n=1 Tax=Collybiopsis luxurians FD-317 M1 TaxID=944289 RepID=A0A0D0B970_9AGAR|nr:hypothetical protein GYMLUDRAFT_43896 [Collybiopsis luxurians FD-317 M1]
MTETIAAYLPSELQDIIIQQILYLDRSSLPITSLVCKDWRHRSYERAFSTVSLRSRSIPVFASFLDNAFSRPAIFSRIRRIRIIGDDSTPLETISTSWSPIQLGALSRLVHHLAELGRISGLALDNFSWAVLDPAMTASLARLNHIECLSMHRIHLTHSRQLSDFVAKFCSLRVFDFQSIECSVKSSSDSRHRYQKGEFLAPEELAQCCLSLYGSNRWMLEKNLTWIYSECIPHEVGRMVSSFGVQTSYNSSDVSDLLRSLGKLLTRLEIYSPGNCALPFCSP